MVCKQELVPLPHFFPPGVQKSKITSSEPHKQIYKVNYSSLWTQILNLNHFSCEISGLPSVAHNSLVHEPVTKEQNLFGNVLKLQISVCIYIQKFWIKKFGVGPKNFIFSPDVLFKNPLSILIPITFQKNDSFGSSPVIV